MIAQAEAALSRIVGKVTMLKAANGAGKAYELFVLSGIALALKNGGYEVWLERADESKILASDTDRKFIQRGGAPSGIPSKFAGVRNGSYVVFRASHEAEEWEIWNGIQFEGRSGGKHEIDIAIIPRQTGAALRSLAAGGIPIGRPRVSIECKDVSLPGSVDETRAFVARLYDLAVLKGHLPHMPGSFSQAAISPGIASHPDLICAKHFKHENDRTFNALVRRSGFASGTVPLVRYYHVKPYDAVLARTANAKALFDAVCNWCRVRKL